MTNPKGVSPHWGHGGTDGLVTSAYARFTLNSPIADPSERPDIISLGINPDGDGFRWSFYCEAEEGAPFNEGEIKWGTAVSLDQAKRETWAGAYQFLISLDYNDVEIAGAVSQPAGSLELDLDNDDDE